MYKGPKQLESLVPKSIVYEKCTSTRHYPQPFSFFINANPDTSAFLFFRNSVWEQDTIVHPASSKSHDADFASGKGDRDVLVIEESCRSLFVSCKVALTLDKLVDVFNSSLRNPTVFFRVLAALQFADVASSLILVPLSLTPEINVHAIMPSTDYTRGRP